MSASAAASPRSPLWKVGCPEAAHHRWLAALSVTQVYHVGSV